MPLGASSVVMFGGGAALFLHNLAELARIERHHGADVVVEAAAVPIPERRGRLVLLAGWVLAMGVTFSWAFHAEGLLPTALGGLLILGGLGAFVALGTGLLGRGWLQFTPAGLVVQQRRERYLVPWDDIASLQLFAWQEVPQIAVGLHRLDNVLLSVEPPGRARALQRRLLQSMQWVGVPLVIVPSRYGLHAEWLHAALVQYTRDPSRRAELVPPAGQIEDRGGS